MLVVVYLYFFFSSRRRHTRLQGDWSSDVCSSDLAPAWRASRRAVAPGEWWRGGPHGLRRFPHARSRANRRTRDAAGPCRARMRGRARLVRPDAAPPRGPPAPDRVPRSRTRGTHRVVPPGPRGSRPPLRPGPNRARVRVARAPTPRETRAPQRGGEDRRSARCGREVPAAPRDPWFGDDQGGPRRGWIRYRDVARGSESMRNGECGMRNDTATLVAGNDPRLAIPHSAFRTPHSRTLSQPNAPIHRLERQASPPAPDRAAQAAGAEPSRDHEGEIGLDVAVDRLGADLGGETGREVERDPAVDGAELERIAPRGAAQRGHDLAVHRLRLGVAGRGNPDTAVHRGRFNVARPNGRLDLAVHRLPEEPHTRRHAHGKVDGHVVVPHVHVTAIACLTRILTAAVARVHGADRNPVLVLHDLDLHLVGVAPARVLHGAHLHVPRAGARADIAVHALDLDRLARGDGALPMELTLGGCCAGRQRQGGRDGEQREHGDAHGHSSWWSSSCLSFSSCLFLRSCPGRQILMSPPNDSSSSRALPEPSVKLNRCLVFPVS